jgi:hypothetical protein
MSGRGRFCAVLLLWLTDHGDTTIAFSVKLTQP